MGVVKSAKRFDIWLAKLNPTQGSEIRKTRPCLIVSPDEMNAHLRTVIVAPMTSVKRDYPSRADIHFADKDGQVALDQLRCVDKMRLAKRLGTAPDGTSQAVSEMLVEMFEI